MAKKKRRRHRHPVAPPIHSAPDQGRSPQPTTPAPGKPTPAQPAPAQPAPGEPAATGAGSATSRRDAVRQRAEARKRRGRRRTWLIAGGLVLAIVAAIVASRVLGGQDIAELNELAAANGCSELEVTGDSGASQHLAEGQTTDYDTTPPTHGEHAPSSLPAGVYEEPFSESPVDQSTIYKAVHSLEHGYILVWHEGLDDDAQSELESTYRGERKVIVVPYEGLEGDTTVAMTAWGRVVRCDEPAPVVIDAFTDLFREARSAPEPNAA